MTPTRSAAHHDCAAAGCFSTRPPLARVMLRGYSMRRIGITTALLCGLGLASFTVSAVQAKTVDTFDFSIGSWDDYSIPGGVGSAIPDAVFTGSFTGVVEPGGLIEQADLSSFNATYSQGLDTLATLQLGGLTLFSFDTTGGASSLDFAGPLVSFSNICVGAAVALDADCTDNFTVAYPPGSTSIILLTGEPFAISFTQPTVTLESSVTPLPAALPLFATGLGAIGLFGWRRKRKASASVAA